MPVTRTAVLGDRVLTLFWRASSCRCVCVCVCLPTPQERAAKWRTSDGLMDGLTTNGVLVMHPAGEFVSEPAPGVWREISVCGNVFALRETRSAQQRGKLVRERARVR